MKRLILTIIIPAIIFASCSEEKKLLRKASIAVDASDFDKALSYYDQILAKDSTSFYGNAGKGVVLSEYVGNHDKAIPYLEKALKKSPDKNITKLNGDLGKSYHHIGNYPRALYFYSKVTSRNTEDNPDYDYYLSKRIADCKYALEHAEIAPPEQQSYKNIGSVINTNMPEYGPIYTHNELIFTSKRKDTPKEKKNGIDGRYFESMYISPIKNGSLTTPRRYTFPDYNKNLKFKKGNESALSATADGKTLFIFRGGKIYEANLNDSTQKEEKLTGNVNFSDFQCYAFVSNDGKTLLFASESDKGRGGTDIYKSIKDENGKWGDPQILSYNINTDYNEDAPFLTEDGTLFFASNGLPGYGGYDIYKTHFENGQWTTPENLGQPINTPGDDIYFVLKQNSPNGFYSSNRKGGFGDMDIYSVRYVNMEVPGCKSTESPIVINSTKDPANEMCFGFKLDIPSEYKNNIRSITWSINGEQQPQASADISYTFPLNSTYTISSKVVVYCDTCPSLIAMCSEKEITVGQPVFVNNNEPIKEAKPNKGKKIQEDMLYGQLSDRQLQEIGWNTTPAYFEYDKSELRADARVILDQNINILKKNKDLSLVINGYTDSRGYDLYNINLSSRRALAVKHYLIQRGITGYRITRVNAYGETKIENGCTDDAACDEEEHQANRKVDFNVSMDRKMISTALK